MDYDDTNWRDEYKEYTISKYELDLLENGPRNLSQSWRMQAMYGKWKRINGYVDPPRPDLSSSFKEFESSINQSSINPEDDTPCNGSNDTD